jgi:hypothetical protein
MIIADFESTYQGFVHSMSYMPVTFTVEKGWKSRGRGSTTVYSRAARVTHGPLTTIIIRDIILDASVREMDDVQKKLAKTYLDAAELGQSEILIMDFKDALEKFLGDVMADDGTWLGHAIDRDVEFLSKTDQRLKTGIFPKDPTAYPNTCCRLANWSRVSRVCTQRILTCRCPRFWEAYTAAGNSSSRLCHLAEFVGCPEQRHTPARDVMDLYTVLARAYEYDTFQTEEGCSYMICKPVRTYEPSHQTTL